MVERSAALERLGGPSSTESVRTPTSRSLIGIGFFGAYTTFSTMAMEGVRLIDSGHVETALIYWILTLIIGQMAGVYGMWLGDEPARRRQAAANIHR